MQSKSEPLMISTQITLCPRHRSTLATAEQVSILDYLSADTVTEAGAVRAESAISGKCADPAYQMEHRTKQQLIILALRMSRAWNHTENMALCCSQMKNCS